MVNLLNNAQKYSPNGGAIRVTVERKDDWAVVWVRDYGIGVPPAERERLFERYYRVQSDEHRQINGIGVGLYISRDIVERHGGNIAAEQPDGEGSLFVLRLPLLTAVSAP
jgi:signal transduction histidine kinase